MIELMEWNSVDDIFAVIRIPMDNEEVPYLADWPVGFGTVLEFFSASLGIRHAIGMQNDGKTIDVRGTRKHAIVLKEIVNKSGWKCGYVDLVFAETLTGNDLYACAINAFPIKNQGTIYFSPAVRCIFLDPPETGMSFGELYIKKCKMIW